MKEINVPNFPHIWSYDKDELETKDNAARLGFSKWATDNIIWMMIIHTDEFPADELRDVQFDGTQYRGQCTGRRFPKYIQFSFKGKQIPVEEDKAMQMNEKFLDIFYEKGCDAVTYRFQYTDKN